MYCIVAFNSVKLVDREKKIRIAWEKAKASEEGTERIMNFFGETIQTVICVHYAHKRMMANNEPMARTNRQLNSNNNAGGI